MCLITTEKDLNIGELICTKCDGGGSWPKKFAELEDLAWKECCKCRGSGKVDWIENIMGKPLRIDLFKVNPDSKVNLYYSGNKLWETTPHGVEIYK
jgi:hypothetical protein